MMMASTSGLWLILMLGAGLTSAQTTEEAAASCYGPGSIATSVILSVLLTALLLVAFYYLWRKYRKRKELILETADPEKGKGEYAFDNFGFKDAGLTPMGKSLEKVKLEGNKLKWNQWAPLSAFINRTDKRKTLDDSAIDGNEVKIVALRSHDFTGLGFNICGNMKEGIYIKDVLHRGPASESGKLNPGDRISSVTISFEHMVYEDALTILSYASPYEVIIEAHGGKNFHNITGQGGQPSHPVYRSASCTDLISGNRSSAKKLFPEVGSNYSSLQKSKSNMTTLERKESSSPAGNQGRTKKTAAKLQLSPEQLKSQLEQKILTDSRNGKIEVEVQKTENKYQKFGVRVLPQDKSPKSAEQNENNMNIEKQPMMRGIDEVDKKPPVKKREKKPEIIAPDSPKHVFNRDATINGSGIKRDANGIPQEIPSYMFNAAVAARSNRKNSLDDKMKEAEDYDNTPKKTKGKAPLPPEEKSIRESDLSSSSMRMNFDEIESMSDDLSEELTNQETTLSEEIEVELRRKDNSRDYNSDSDLESEHKSNSPNTIELNSSDITIHHSEDNEDRQNRRTASTGDLTKIHKTTKSNNGTLERAQSLDITDTSLPTLNKKRKSGRIEDDMTESEEDIFGKVVMSKEPRLSLILDGLNTFQRSRLKKSTEWGNLEDAILKSNQEDEDNDNRVSLEDMKFGFGTTSQEFDALVNKINEIKSEENEEIPEVITPTIKKVKNQIWPKFDNDEELTKSETSIVLKEPVAPRTAPEKRQRKPPQFEELQTFSEPPPEKPPVKKTFTESRIPLMKSPKVEEPVPVSNECDENKSKSPVDIAVFHADTLDLTRKFIFTEKIACSQDEDDYSRYLIKADDTNISDDLKISKNSLESLERPASDDAKINNVSSVAVNNNTNSPEALREDLGQSYDYDNEDIVSFRSMEQSELYTTALDKTIRPDDESANKVTITTPDIIKNVTITEAINTLNNDVTIQGPSSLTVEIPENKNNKVSFGITPNENGGANFEAPMRNVDSSANKSNNSMTYITEIQVMTPNNVNKAKNGGSKTNISEIEIIPNVNNDGRNLDSEFEDYVRNFETNVKSFETNIQKFENNLDTSYAPVMKTELVRSDSMDAEKELHKIQEIAEEQLKTLPEMRFITSSYESDNKRQSQSQIELLRSNFEKQLPPHSPIRTKETTPPKSRIPIATGLKTPPTSPERRDSRTLDMEQDKAILELMSASVHSTPMVSHAKHQLKSPNKNVTVTSIRSNSKIPSGLPVLSVSSRPPVPPRKVVDGEESQNTSNGGVQNSFKQWVFNPSDSVTNIVVPDENRHE